MLLFQIVSTGKKIGLPDKFTIVKAVSINEKAQEVTLKSIQQRKININYEFVKKTQWLDHNI